MVKTTTDIVTKTTWIGSYCPNTHTHTYTHSGRIALPGPQNIAKDIVKPCCIPEKLTSMNGTNHPDSNYERLEMRFTTKPTGHTWHADYIFHYTQGEVTLQKYVVTIRSLCCRATRRTVKTQYAIYTHYTACHVKLSDEDLSRYLNKMESVGLRKSYYHYLAKKVM